MSNKTMSDAPATPAPDAPNGAPVDGDATTPPEAPEGPSVEALTADVETWKGHARRWETQSKANAEKATAYDALKAEHDETATRATDAENRALAAESDVARLSVAVEFGLSQEDTEALKGVTDAESLRALAGRLSAVPSGQVPNPAQGNRSHVKAAQSTDEQGVSFFEEMLNN